MDRNDLPNPRGQRWGIAILALLTIAVPMALSMGVALVAVAPFLILAVPAVYLIWREHEYDLHKDRPLDPELVKTFGSHYTREARKHRITDDRVIK
jgi:hypothetical protein